MTSAAETAAGSVATGRRDPTKKNVLLLALCQALSMSGNSVIITVSALVGFSLATDKSLATLPIAIQFTFTMLGAFPAAFLMRRFGRRLGFSVGALLGVAAGGIGAWGIWEANFWLFLAASVPMGLFQSFAQYYRFAAADTASEAFRPKAISLVLAGGVIAAIAGPELAKWSRDLFTPVLFAGSYLAIAGLAVAVIGLLQFIEIPRLTAAQRADHGRPLAVIARQPKFIVAVLSAAIGYGVMSLVMTATPLAMVACGFAFNTAASVIQWHALAMFLPSFFTGSLIARFGAERIILVGAVLNGLCLAINLTGVEFFQFWSALVLLGLGWNFMFIGGTTLATETYSTSERAKTQALNDFLVFTTVALAAFSSGALHSSFGWAAVNLGVAPPLMIAAAAVVWLMLKGETATPARTG
ncbi:MAG: MFS transporter [Alphaproteobacteria bacterium]|jgi:MFS family permease|nr:MFS transporter [Alphaproteobacteria bacterium]